MLQKATGLSITELRLNDDIQLNTEAKKNFENMMEQRKNHIPLQYILGQWEFMGLPINCRPGVLIPRADTEVLAEEAINFLKSFDRGLALDLCTGSGCVAISLAHFCPQAHISAVDISPTALELAQQNAKLNKVEKQISFIKSDLFNNVSGKFDCITVNPPYISSAEMATLSEEVKQEPTLALHGGEDGLDFYRAIIPACNEYLRPTGVVFFEIGATQGRAVTDLLHDSGFRGVTIIKDLEDRHRVVQANANPRFKRS